MLTGAIVTLLILSGLVGFQILLRMKNIPPSQLAVVHGRRGEGGIGFKTLKGGRVFVLPLINDISIMDLTPKTTTVEVDSAIAKGIVPLVVKATVSFGLSTTPKGIINAVQRILVMSWENLIAVANSIIEGHLRGSLAQMTPEEVMSHKERLVKSMLQVCRGDLEAIGLEITTMNIADVEDHRFDGVEEPDLYIALLKRVQTANAETQSRTAQAEALAAATEEQEARRTEVQVRAAENEIEALQASTDFKAAQEEQRSAVGVEENQRVGEAEVAGILRQIEAEKQGIAMLEEKFRAEIVTPAKAQRERKILVAEAEAASIRGLGEAEVKQLENTINILKEGGENGIKAYVIEKFDEMISSFAATMDLFSTDHVSVVSGKSNSGPISAVHPGAFDLERNRLIGESLGGALQETGFGATASTDGGRSGESATAGKKGRS
jgi:flotillin